MIDKYQNNKIITDLDSIKKNIANTTKDIAKYNEKLLNKNTQENSLSR